MLLFERTCLPTSRRKNRVSWLTFIPQWCTEALEELTTGTSTTSMSRPRPRHPIPLQLFSSHADEYDAWFDAPPGSLLFPGEAAALQLLRQDVSRPWLEVGVGTGRFGSNLGVDLGLDPSIAMLSHAQHRGLAAVQGTGDALPFRDGAVGCVLLVTVLCFVTAPDTLLREALRVLRDDGALLVGEILANRAWSQHYQHPPKERRSLYRYARFPSLRELEELLRRAGFFVTGRACSVVQSPGRVVSEEQGWWGVSPRASFIALLARKRTP